MLDIYFSILGWIDEARLKASRPVRSPYHSFQQLRAMFRLVARQAWVRTLAQLSASSAALRSYVNFLRLRFLISAIGMTVITLTSGAHRASTSKG